MAQFPNTRWPLGRSSPSMRTADALQWGIRKLQSDSDDVLVVIDADLIPFRRIDLDALLSTTDFRFRLQKRQGSTMEVSYPWNGYFISRTSLVRYPEEFYWDIDEVDGASCDTGGALGAWLSRHMNRGHAVQELTSGSWDWRELGNELPQSLHAFLEFDRVQAGGAELC
jgi:hypothetical protein